MEITASPGSSGKSSDRLIRVLVEDPELIRWEELHGALPANSGFVVFERSGTLEQVLNDCEIMAPCVLVASYELVRDAGPTALRERLCKMRGVSVLVRGPDSRRTAEQLLAQGVMGLLPETVNGFLLRKAIRAVDRGEVWAGRLLVSRLLRRLQIRLATQDLSDREIEVLELIADGLSNREIADKLFICRETVRWHIRSLYSKIGAKDRASAVRYAKEYLLVELGSLDPIPPRISPRDSKIADEKMAAD